ncbi:tobamovirus multiplication protein 2A-like [Zingiber officinale]|uniref:tobamovirus multiplication protein 2A-like n=1 Tax=Zingiber officinale TaxID=94328 RepID=UPI001C4D82D0|nr:tobamovirus multiplication protein 2A-like [Zingiber officinale]XP_042409076.1 tobamovirus multiplication protein 2A-like [Zingiber officinale]
MACKGFWECLLKLLNFVLTVTGLAMVGYGIYLLVEWNKIAAGGGGDDAAPPASNDLEFLKLGRPMLVAVSFSSSFLDYLPKAWFIYLFIGIGAVVFVISCFGCIGAVSRNGCCLSFYAFLVFLLIVAELAVAAFIFFDHSWKELIPDDKTGNFDGIYDFLDSNWKIAKWVALGAVIFEGFVFVLALIVRSANRPAEYDSDDELIAPRSTIRQPLVNRQGAAASGAPVLGSLDHRPSRNDAWSQRMREKYGLDTSEFTYNPSDPNRYQQATASQTEEKGRCTIL